MRQVTLSSVAIPVVLFLMFVSVWPTAISAPSNRLPTMQPLPAELFTTKNFYFDQK